MLVKVENNEIVDQNYSISKLKRDNPNVSFSKTISEETLNSYGAYTVVAHSRPVYNSKIEHLESTVQSIDGVWTRTWTKVALPDSQCAGNNRIERDRLLADSDWTQMNDSPLSNEDKTAWATYRQELRDITSHSNWPNLEDADWPTKP
jgi:hypothetical protein